MKVNSVEKYNIWYYLVYMMAGLEKYPVTKQIACWFYLDSKAAHPSILYNARPLYIEEVISSFDAVRVFN